MLYEVITIVDGPPWWAEMPTRRLERVTLALIHLILRGAMDPQIAFPRQLLRSNQMVSRFVVFRFPCPVERLGHFRLSDSR